MISYGFENGQLLSGDRDNSLIHYIFAQNGVFVEGIRPELHIRKQIAKCEIRGVCNDDNKIFKPGLVSVVLFHLPRVPQEMLLDIIYRSMIAGREGKEILFWLSHSELNPNDNGWLLITPEQEQTFASCRPLDGQDNDHNRTIIEIHSHHSMSARFSSQDNADETGFRIYSVVGGFPGQAMIRTRVGLYGYFHEIPSLEIFHLPKGVVDAINED